MSEHDRQSDAVLMARIRDGDSLAFEALYGRYGERVFAYVWRALGDKDAAADLRQEVFMRVWHTRAKWRPTGSVEGYLLRIASRMVVDQQRKQRVRSRWLASAPIAFQKTSAPPDREVMARQNAARVNDAIAGLPERMREVFSLKRDAGLSYQQISEHLGISIKTVEVHMGRALKRLREQLDDLKSGG